MSAAICAEMAAGGPLNSALRRNRRFLERLPRISFCDKLVQFSGCASARAAGRLLCVLLRGGGINVL